MIKFFRKIRQKLLVEKSFNKYLFYAVGEIILVVIGILIALQINNWNEEQNNEQKVIKILKQVQKDLLNDIQEAQYFSDGWEKQDKMLTHFFKATKPEQYYRDNFSYFKIIGLATTRFVQNRQGFNRLNEQIDIVSSKYDAILSKLSRLYNERSDFLNKNQTVSNNLVQDYRIYLHNNYDWMENFKANEESPEEVFTYFYSSKKHRKNLVKYRAFFNRYHNQVSGVKNQSLLCYLMIRKITNDTSELPKVIKSFGLEYSNNNIEDFIGNYFIKKDSVSKFIEKKYGVLFWSTPKQRELYFEGYILREYGKDSLGFVFANIYPIKFLRDTKNKVTGFKAYDIHNSGNTIEAIKLD
ncbi:DUF6090 family protein [Polaribacter aquimarinus]|uniref:Uncharacterized protein n=1 Tax=Polaribacter aquimarinus TaxID=2100726 RepID=A0A2U2JDP9_9FLAO|nr:DUF6090 family protein [Polaribacter aquimarinus]PWG06468.1 hypothetical protein DIS07_01150 [Polaribacter aquimarinus]